MSSLSPVVIHDTADTFAPGWANYLFIIQWNRYVFGVEKGGSKSPKYRGLKQRLIRMKQKNSHPGQESFADTVVEERARKNQNRSLSRVDRLIYWNYRLLTAGKCREISKTLHKHPDHAVFHPLICESGHPFFGGRMPSYGTLIRFVPRQSFCTYPFYDEVRTRDSFSVCTKFPGIQVSPRRRYSAPAGRGGMCPCRGKRSRLGGLENSWYICTTKIWASPTRPAPGELPQGLTAARATGCSGAM